MAIDTFGPTIEPIPRPRRGPAGWITIAALVLLGLAGLALYFLIQAS